MIESIFIDWDDTIVHNQETVRRFKELALHQKILNDAGLTCLGNIDESIKKTEEKFSALNYPDNIKKGVFYELLLNQLEIRVANQKIFGMLDDLYNKYYASITEFMPGAEQFLNQTSRKRGLVLISDGYSDRVDAQLSRLGLENTFSESYFANRHGFKSEGKIFEIARRNHSDSEHLLYLGDNPLVDIEAKKYGFHVILVGNGYSDYSELPSDVKLLTFDQLSMII